MHRGLFAAPFLFAAGLAGFIQAQKDEPKAVTAESMTQTVLFKHADHLRGRDDGDQPGFPREFRIVSMEAPADVRDELKELFPDAELSGWQVRSSQPRTIVFDFENVRETLITRHAHLELEPDRPIRLMSCLTPVEHGNLRSLRFTLYTIETDYLLEVFEGTIDDHHEDLAIKVGWNRRAPTILQLLGHLIPLAILSWNPAGSDLALEDALARGGLWITGAVDEDWFHRGVATWPRPVWILGLHVFARGE